ncbi:enoyl-CoA hydratase/isomerase family protein [Natronoarchaeum sp. GCM10025321]|uniref:enoyl-CoA hydratase/isomerase family protein n=1 Tax=Natronoarchaeum sp. GCM10025321 TaxID=3252684 RepID=UPI00360AEE2D
MIDESAAGDVRTVTLARPERRNALTSEGLDELEDAITGAEEPVVYLHGAGSAFCAGADLDVVDALDDSGAAAEFAARGQQVARAIETAEPIVVAGIDGPARGGGVELALACDVRIATSDATFGEPGVSFGLFGAWGGTVRLPEVVGLGDAMEFSVTGRELDAEEARRIGLVSRLVERPDAVAREIAENDPAALAVLKKRLHDTSSRAEQERREAAAFAELVMERKRTNETGD